MFTGESIWMGGMPMTVGTNDPICLNNGVNLGWRNCPNEQDANGKTGFTSIAWKDHNSQIAYYTVATVRNPSVSNNLLDKMWKGSCINDDKPKNNGSINRNCQAIDAGKLNALVAFSRGKVNPLPNDRQKRDFVTDVLVNIKTAQDQKTLNQIRRGDYVWINSGGTNNHGLLVVGWERMMDCDAAINANLKYDQLRSKSSQASLTVAVVSKGSFVVPNIFDVPYVVDYSYGVIPGQPPLQSTVPRPFYCTRFNESGMGKGRSNFGDSHLWTFLNFPDAVEILPSLLYVDPTWTWTTTSR
jgi:hypothetical protein